MNMSLNAGDILSIIVILIVVAGLILTIDNGIHPERYAKQDK